jgi:hypothetical protein
VSINRIAKSAFVQCSESIKYLELALKDIERQYSKALQEVGAQTHRHTGGCLSIYVHRQTKGIERRHVPQSVVYLSGC